MPINLDNVFASHSIALEVASRRLNVLATNLANADTPNYKARDLDFRRALDNAESASAMQATHAAHIAHSGSGAGVQTLYRVPTQSSLDGNTVDTQLEKAKFSENAVRYQTTLRFLNSKISGLMKAIKGE